jgi:CRISPR-associated protein Csd1
MNIEQAIDETRTEPAYHLGRLFAVYEHAQKNAHDWKLKRTIRETMYSSASSTPLAVFGRLERLHHYHTAKKSHPKGGTRETTGSYADMIREIKQHFKGQTPIYPASLNLVDQSLFAVGYYHQMQHFQNILDNSDKNKEAVTKPEN